VGEPKGNSVEVTTEESKLESSVLTAEDVEGEGLQKFPFGGEGGGKGLVRSFTLSKVGVPLRKVHRGR